MAKIITRVWTSRGTHREEKARGGEGQMLP